MIDLIVLEPILTRNRVKTRECIERNETAKNKRARSAALRTSHLRILCRCMYASQCAISRCQWICKVIDR